ncbi:MAG: methyltransferase domain-containing protein, partial [Planctomycetota bacterium]
MTHHSALVSLFDRLAADGTADRYEALHDDIARQVLDAMEVRPGHQLLDAGCGAGWVTRRLGKKAPGAQAVGIDASAAMISRADEVSDWTSRARFECMTIEDIDFPEGRFDHVFALDTLEYVEDLAAAGVRHRACPYYAARRALPRADLVFAPYASVLQKETR